MRWGKDGFYGRKVTDTNVFRGRSGSEPRRHITIEYDDGVTATHSLHNTTVVAGGTGEPKGKAVTTTPALELDDSDLDAVVTDIAHRVAAVASATEFGRALEEVNAPDNTKISVISLERRIFDVESSDMVRSSETLMLIGDKNYSIDTNDHAHWHEPSNERDYNLSPQRALWRTAKELKMDQYEAINVWTLVPKPKGVNILRTVWAYKIKTTGTGTFDKRSVRVCAVGTGMDRDIYAAYSDVMRMSSLIIIIAI